MTLSRWQEADEAPEGWEFVSIGRMLGSQGAMPAAELRERVRETHGMNAHAVQYEAAITFIEVCFASDMAEGRFAVKEARS